MNGKFPEKKHGDKSKVPRERKPKNAYASYSRRCLFAELGIQDMLPDSAPCEMPER